MRNELKARWAPFNDSSALSGDEATQGNPSHRSVGIGAGQKRGNPACSPITDKQCGDEGSCLSDQHCGAGVEAAAHYFLEELTASLSLLLFGAAVLFAAVVG